MTYNDRRECLFFCAVATLGIPVILSVVLTLVTQGGS